MADRTIDESTYTTLERSFALLQKLNSDPETRGQLEASIKKHFPEVTTEADTAQRLVAPHLERFQADVANPILEELKQLREERAAATTQRVENTLTEAFTDIRRRHDFTDDGIEAVKKLMVDRSIADPHAAALLFRDQNPVPREQAPSWQPQSWNMDQNLTDFDLKGLFENEDAWADKMAGRALNEIRLGQAA